MPPKSNLVHLPLLDSLEFVTAKSAVADFTFADDIGMLLRVEAHAPGVYRMRCGRAERVRDEKPSPRARALAESLLARQEPVGEFVASSAIDLPEGGWRLEQGDVALELDQSPIGFTLRRGGEPVLRLAEMTRAHRGADGFVDGWRLVFDLDVDDGLYGLGETGAGLDRRGECLVSDRAADRMLPVVWSPLGWGLYFNTLGRVAHDLGMRDPDQYAVEFDAPVLDVFIFAGDPAEILNQYTALSGRAGQPGLWPMGVWLSQAPGRPISQLVDAVERLRAAALPLDAVELAPPAAYGFQADKPALEWDSSRIPDARDLLHRLGALNVQVAVPSFPGVDAGTGLFREWEDRGWLLMNDDGTAHVFPGNASTSGRPCGLLDLTQKDVFNLWVERQRQMVDDGVGALTCDARLDIPDGVGARGGEEGAVLRALYPLLVRRALFQAVAGHKTPQEGVVCSTDLFPSAQRYAWQVELPASNDWRGFEQSLRMALSTGNSGIAAQMHSLGYVAGSDERMAPELYIRWLAANVFSANFSFQAVPSLLPDAFDDGTRELARHWLRWRYRLIPYVLGIIEDAVRGGLPVRRSMALAFPADPMAQVWESQYLFGPALLVAPILHPGTETRVYLPAGDAWWDLNTGRRYEGGTTWTVTAGLDTLPVFGREGHMLCLGPAAQHTGEFNSARILEEVWMFGMPEHSPVVMRNKIRVMQMQGSSYIKGLEGLRILPSEGLEVKRRGAEVRISRIR